MTDLNRVVPLRRLAAELRVRAVGRPVVAGLVVAAVVALAGAAHAQTETRRFPAPDGRGFFWAPEQLDELVEVMTRWSRYDSPSPEESKRIFAAAFDPRVPQATICIRAIEKGLVEHLEEQDPDSMLPLTFWQVEMVFLAQAWSGRDGPETSDFERVLGHLVRYHDGASKKAKTDAADARIDRLTQLGYLGVGELYFLRGSPALLERADQAFQLAVAKDADFRPARYWAAFLQEKIRAPVDALRPWRELVADFPDESEYRLRFGLVARRAERDRRAAESLKTVARSGAPAWMRTVAYEEWVQVLLDGSARERELAADVLREARRELPGRVGLDLLAVYLALPDSRREALRLAERVESSRPADEMLPRVRYELPQPEQVEAARRLLIDELRVGRVRLADELQEINPAHFFRWHVPPICQPLTPG